MLAPHGDLRAQETLPQRKGGGRSHPFDVLHTAIDVRFDMEKREVIGSATHRIRSLSPALGTIRLDAAANMRYSLVTVDGFAAPYRQLGDTLAIDLPTGPRHYSDTLTLRLDYRVVPKKGLYFIGPDSLKPETRSQIWTQGEDEDNHFWVPLYDYPNERATSEVTVRVRSGWKALSNGTLRSTTRNEDGTSTWHWAIDRPHAGYLIMIAAGDYLVTRDTSARVPLEYWSYPDMPDRVVPTFGRTQQMMSFFENLIGVPYPWSQYSQIMIDEFMYGGMENTTATTLNDYLLVDAGALVDYDPDPTIAHELAHQWYGDLVTNRSWADLWIHESYATYLENQWMRRKVGEEWYAREIELNGREGIESDLARGRDRLVGGKGLDANVYARGARILHMLERIVGTEIFWRANRHFLEKHAYGLVETNDLKIAFEEVSGLNLDWFFDEWIYGGGYPEYRVEQTIERDTLALTIRQTQRRDSIAGLFAMPVPLEFHLADRIVRDTILVSNESETFRFPMKQAPAFVIFDAGNAVLKSVDFPRTDAVIIAQLEAPRMIDRWLAVRDLTRLASKEKPAPARVAALHRRFMREPSAYVRQEIVRGVAVFDSPLVAEIVRRALVDSSAAVRGEAIQQAFRITDRKERNDLLLPLMRDSSRGNAGGALGMLAASGSPALIPYLTNLRGVRGPSDQTLLTWLNAVAAGGYTRFVDDVAVWAMPPYSRSLRTQALSTLAYLDTVTVAMLRAVESGLRDSSTSIRMTTGNVVRKHRGGEVDALLQSLRDQLSGVEREYVVKLLREEALPRGRGRTRPAEENEKEGNP